MTQARRASANPVHEAAGSHRDGLACQFVGRELYGRCKIRLLEEIVSGEHRDAHASAPSGD